MYRPKTKEIIPAMIERDRERETSNRPNKITCDAVP